MGSTTDILRRVVNKKDDEDERDKLNVPESTSNKKDEDRSGKSESGKVSTSDILRRASGNQTGSTRSPSVGSGAARPTAQPTPTASRNNEPSKTDVKPGHKTLKENEDGARAQIAQYAEKRKADGQGDLFAQVGGTVDYHLGNIKDFLFGNEYANETEQINDEAKRLYGALTSADAPLSLKGESGKSVIDSLSDSKKALDGMEQRLGQMMEEYKRNPSDALAAQYDQLATQYNQAVAEHNKAYAQYEPQLKAYNDALNAYNAYVTEHGDRISVPMADEYSPYREQLDALESEITRLGKRKAEIHNALSGLSRAAQYGGAVNLEGKRKEYADEIAAIDAQLLPLEARRNELVKEGGYLSDDDILGGLAYGGERFLAGALGMGENITDFIGTTLYGALEGVTSLGGYAPNPVSKWAGDAYDSFAGNSITADYEESIRQRYTPTPKDEELTGFMQTVEQVALPIAAGYGISKLAGMGSGATTGSLAAPNTATIAANATKGVFGANAAGGATREAHAAGASHAESLTYGWLVGAMEMSVEELSGAIPGLPDGSKMANVVKKVFSDPRVHAVVSHPAVQRLLGGVGEGAEEALSAIFTPYIQRATYDPNAPLATAEDIGEQALLGGLASLCIGAGIDIPAYVAESIYARNRLAVDEFDAETIQGILDTGLESPTDTNSYKIAAELKQKLDAGKDLMASEVMDLYRENVKQVNAENAEQSADEAIMDAAREAVGVETQDESSRETDTKPSMEFPSWLSAEERVAAVAAQERGKSEHAIKKLTGYGEAGVKAFQEATETYNLGAFELRKAFDTPYQAGLTGLAMDQADLRNDFQRNAFNAGRLDHITRMTRDEQHKPKAVLSEAESGFDHTNAPADVSQADRDFSDWFAKKLGVKGSFETDEGTPYNAFFDPGSDKAPVSFAKDFGIDPQLMTKLGSRSFQEKVERLASEREESFIFYVGHEMAGHVAADRAPKEMRAFFNGMYNYLQSVDSDEYSARDRHTLYARNKVNLDMVGAVEEIGSDSILKLYDGDEKKFMDAMRRVYDSLDSDGKQGARTYLAKLKEFIQKLKAWARKLTGRENAEARVNVEKGITELERLRDMFEQAIGTAMRNVREARQTGQTTTEQAAVGDVKNSIKSFATASGIEASRDPLTGKVAFKLDGKLVSKVTPAHIERNSGLGGMITTAMDNGFISEDEAKIQYKAVADIMNMIINTQDPEMVWAWVGSAMFSAIKSNADGQYGTTIDFTTVCRKTQDMITAMSKAMMELKRGLTKDEVTKLQAELIAEGSSVPCPVCYVFSRWAGIGSVLDNMYKWQERYDGFSEAQIQERIQELTEKLGKGKSRDLVKMLKEQDEEYDNLAYEKEKLALEKKQLTSKRKTAVRENDAHTLLDINNRLAEIDKRNPQITKRMKTIKDSVAPELAWLIQVRAQADYETHGKVEANVLFNLDGAARFAEEFPLAWKYRTSRGPSAGKAILPYSDMRLGDMILGVDNTSADGNDLFANATGKFTPAQKAAVDKATARARAQNLIGGQRFQSTSDFRYDYALDYLMAFWEAQAIGSKMQTYTKIVEFGDMVAAVGGDFNLSVMPRNKGYITLTNGKNQLIFSSVTGIDFEAAKRSSQMHDNGQLILVGINDQHILAALEDSEETRGIHIGFVIPYHASGASINEFIRVLVSNLGETFNSNYYQDYSDVQSDKERGNATAAQKRRNDLRSKLLRGKDGGKNWEPSAEDLAFIRGKSKSIEGRSFAELREIERKALRGDKAAIAEYESWTAGALWDLYTKMWTEGGTENGVRLNTNQAKAVMPHEYWNKNVTRDQAYINGFLFRSYCYNLGLTPRFSGAVVKGVKHGDFTDSKGYWKTLIDRPMYNNDGTYRNQQIVNMSSFNKEMLTPDYAKKNWDGYAVQEPDAQRATRAAERFVEKLDGGKKYSLVKGKATLDHLNNQEWVKVYRAMFQDETGLYPPMGAIQGGKKVAPMKFDTWYQADEHPELIKFEVPKRYVTGEKTSKGEFRKSARFLTDEEIAANYAVLYGTRKENAVITLSSGVQVKFKELKPKFELKKADGGTDVPAAYNPYFHTSLSALNDQFDTAYKRPGMVVVEGYIPSSELTSGYRALYAKDPVGETTWKSGVVANHLKGEKARKVFLSRWFRAGRVVPDAEAAQMIAKVLEGEDLKVPWNVVTPALREALENAGVDIDYDRVYAGTSFDDFQQESGKQYSLKDYDTYQINWAINNGVISAKNKADLIRAIDNEIYRGYSIPRTKDGNYIVESGNVMMFTDGDRHNPSLDMVIVLDDEYETFMATAKEVIYNEAQSGDVHAAAQLIERIYWPGYASIHSAETYRADGGYGRRGKRSVRQILEDEAGGGRNYSLKIDTKGLPDDAEQESKDVIGALKRDEMMSRYGSRKYASYTSDRIEAELNESMVDGVADYAHSYIAWVDPLDFLHATTSGAEYRKRIRSEAGELRLDELRANEEPIYLIVNEKRGEVVGHEGRHRMTALMDSGIDRVAVVVRVTDRDMLIHAHSDRYNGKLLWPKQYWRLSGQKFDTMRGASITLQNLLPLSERYADAARKLFSEVDGSTQYSLKGERAMRDEIKRIREEGAKAGKSEAEIESDIMGVVGPEYKELIKVFGEIKRGERPAREIQVPQESEEDRKVSQTIRTVLEAEVTPESAIPTIEQMVTQGDFSYDVITDKAAMDAAKKYIRTNKYPTALANWLSEVRAGKVSKANTALGWELYNQAATSGDLDTAITILDEMVKHQRNAAQAVQASRILKKLSPDAQLYSAVKSVQKLEEDINEKRKPKKKGADKAAKEVGEAKKDAADAAKKAHKGVRGMRKGGDLAIDSNQAGEPFVFEYAQKVGEAVAKGLEAGQNRVEKERTFLQQITAELKRFAEEKMPKKEGKKSLTAVDLLRSYVQNQEFFADAWQYAQEELREKYADDSAFDEFLNTGIGVDANANPQNAIFMRALVKAAADSGEGKAVLRRQSALGFTGMANTIADNLIQQTGAKGEMADTIRDAAHAYVLNTLKEEGRADADIVASSVRSAMSDIGLKISDVVMSGTGESAKQTIVANLVGKYGIGLAEATNTAEVVAESFDKMCREFSQRRLETMFKERKVTRKTIQEKFEQLARLGAFDIGSAYNQRAAERIFREGVTLTIDEGLARKFLEAKTQEERDSIMADIYRDVGRQMPSTFIDKWNAWRYLSMLGNFRTHGRNLAGNAFFAPVVLAKDMTATGIEAAVNFVTRGKVGRTKAIPTAELLKAAWADYANIADEIMAGGKYSDTAVMNQHIEDGRRIFGRAEDARTGVGRLVSNTLGKGVEFARRKNSEALEVEDKWFAHPHYAFALAQYCKANGVTADQLRRGKALGNARAYAIKEAQKATYRDTNALSETVSALGRYNGDNMVKKGLSVVVEGILPFRKTPANILARGIEYSPIGLVKSITWDLVRVKNGDITAAEMIDNLSSGLTGTGLLGLGAWLAAEGLIRGRGGDDEEEKEFEELQGHQAYSLELPDGTSVTLDWLAPESLPFFVGVNLYEMTRDNKGDATLSDILTAVSNVTEPMLEMSCLQSLNDIFESVGYASSNDMDPLPAVLTSAATSYLTQGVPTIFGQTERSTESVRMTTYPEKNAFLTTGIQRTLGKVSAKTPGWDYQQIPYIDAWGRTESTGNPVANVANNFLNPAYTSQIETSAMEEELARLYDATGEASVFPSRADKYFTVDEERKDLTAQEYVKYATEKGQLSYKVVTALTKSDAYKSMTDFERVEAVDLAYDYANAVAKTKVSKYAPEGWIAKAIATSKSTGLSPDKYIPLYMAQKDIESLKNSDGNSISDSRGLQVMQMVYNAKGLTTEQRRALFDDFGVGKSIIHYNPALVNAKLEKMRKKK